MVALGPLVVRSARAGASTVGSATYRIGAPLVVVAILLLTSCGGGTADTAGVADVPTSAMAAVCQDVPPSAGCRSIAAASGVIRYRRVVATGGSGGEAILVDGGGPGRVLFGPDQGFLGSEIDSRGYDTLELEEPWVQRPLPAACRSKLSQFLDYVRGGASEAPRLGLECDLSVAGNWTWTDSSYRAAWDAVLAAENLKAAGAVGVSFGAIRVRALSQQERFGFVVVASPAHPASTEYQYLANRGDLVRDLLGELCGCSTEAGAMLDDRAAELDGSILQTADRSVPLTSGDAYAAALALPYASEAERAAFGSLLRGNELTLDVASMVGSLADSVLLRYGVADVSPALLAYYDGVCRYYDIRDELGRMEQRAASLDGLDRFLARYHAPCAEIGGEGAGTAPYELRASTSCAGFGGSDLVVGSDGGDAWSAQSMATIPDAAHGDPRLIEACLQKVVPT